MKKFVSDDEKFALIAEMYGMHTNGGCQCRRSLNRTPEGKSAVRTIDFLRRQLEQEVYKEQSWEK